MEAVLRRLHMKIFVDTDDDTRLARRIRRDVSARGRDVDGVIKQYTRFVKPSFDSFVLPSKKRADVVIPWGDSEESTNGEGYSPGNCVAVDLIAEHIRTKLGLHGLCRIFPNLHLLPANFQTRGMHTIIRSRDSSKHDFIFYADRLIRLAVEHALGYLPFTETVVVTPTGARYAGIDFSNKLCGVSVIRSGEAMENALRACCKGIKIGKVLVQRGEIPQGDGSTEAERKGLIYQKLPTDIASRHVLVMDPILGTGYSASRAVSLLVDAGVKEERILFVSLIAAPEGVRRLFGHHPQIKVVTSEIDDGLTDDTVAVLPGVGDFGDRYFGTE
tara:strand:+ start:357 stop:1346 length:990 start_codon:yes stop_codon:yes gene_type:complete